MLSHRDPRRFITSTLMRLLFLRASVFYYATVDPVIRYLIMQPPESERFFGALKEFLELLDP